jgi:hypothetical protein
VRAIASAALCGTSSLRGDMTIIKLPVELGADSTIADTEFNATPSGWANHAGHADAAKHLEQRAVSRPVLG